jgi:hypothetical protein
MDLTQEDMSRFVDSIVSDIPKDKVVRYKAEVRRSDGQILYDYFQTEDAMRKHCSEIINNPRAEETVVNVSGNVILERNWGYEPDLYGEFLINNWFYRMNRKKKFEHEKQLFAFPLSKTHDYAFLPSARNATNLLISSPVRVYHSP